MPQYSFICDKCKVKMEKKLSYDDKENPYLAPKCSICGGETRYIFDFAPLGNIRIFNGVV
jgi:hypothetical protein